MQEAKPDPARAKLEADLAASEKARVQAELRATTLDADAIRARASADAAALRAKAESEAADTKAKAQVEAAAVRGKAAQEANRSKASDADAIRARAEADAAALTSKAASDAATAKSKSEADIAAMQAKAAQDAKLAQEAAMAKAAQDSAAAKTAAAPVAEASRNDGVWVMTQQCSANQHAPPFTRSADFFVRGGEFTIERGTPGQPGYNITRGRPSADGTLVLTGNGIGSQGRGTGQPFDIRLDGRWTGDRYVLRGTWGGRLCDVAVARR